MSKDPEFSDYDYLRGTKLKKTLASVLPFIICTGVLSAHDTFLKFESYHLKPQSQVSVSLMNGTIEESENSVSVDRFRDVRIVGPAEQIQRPNNSKWQLTDKLSKLAFVTGAPGTYVAGVSIKPRNLKMSADAFDQYLQHSGVADVFKERQTNKSSKKEVVEKYSKHVKAIFQVGENHSDSYEQAFDYPIEIIPLQNPGSLRLGDRMSVKINIRGKPVSNQLVYASYLGHHKHDEADQHIEAVQTRTNNRGEADIKIVQKGLWYIRLIHMVASNETGIDYESNWATLTFEIK